jgi:6-phosphogluconolactonase (cycloisomerase 2 family)
VFHSGGRLLFDLQEHDGALVAYRFDPATGRLSRLGAQSTLPAGFAGSDVASELCLSRDGRFLYAGNRLRNSITTFVVGRAGELREVAETWTQSDYPRSFALDPSRRLLICCNQRGDNLTSFHVDPRSGALSFTGRFQPVGSPAAVAFFAG